MTFPNPAQRQGWFSQQYECVLPTDADERAEYIEQLAHEAEHGPADNPTTIYATKEQTC